MPARFVVGFAGLGELGEPRLQQRQPGRQRVPQQVPGGDERGQQRGRPHPVAAGEEDRPRALVVLGRLGVVVGGGGLCRPPHQQRHQPCLVAVAQAADRPVQQVEGLVVRRQRTGPFGGGSSRRRRLGQLAGGLVVRRPVAVPAQLGAAPRELRDPGVQGAAGRERSGAADGVPDQGVAEPEPSARLRLEELSLDELVDAVCHHEVGLLDHGGDQLEVEAAADDGRRDRDVACRRGEHAEPLADRVRQRLRDVRRIGGQVALHQRLHQLLDVQGHAARAPLHQVDERGGRDALRQQLGHHPRRLLGGQPGERDLLGHPLQQQPRTPRAYGQVGVQLVGAHRPDHQHPPRPQPSGEVRDDVEAQLVAPVQVLQGQQHRAVVGEGEQPGDGVEDEQSSLAVGVAGAGRRRGKSAQVVDQGLSDADDTGVVRARHRVTQVQQQARGELDVLRERRRTPHDEAPGGGQVVERLQEAGLADPRLAGEQQQPALAGTDVGDEAFRSGERPTPPVQRGPDQLRSPTHPTSLPPMPVRRPVPAPRAFSR